MTRRCLISDRAGTPIHTLGAAAPSATLGLRARLKLVPSCRMLGGQDLRSALSLTQVRVLRKQESGEVWSQESRFPWRHLSCLSASHPPLCAAAWGCARGWMAFTTLTRPLLKIMSEPGSIRKRLLSPESLHFLGVSQKFFYVTTYLCRSTQTNVCSSGSRTQTCSLTCVTVTCIVHMVPSGQWQTVHFSIRKLYFRHNLKMISGEAPKPQAKFYF